MITDAPVLLWGCWVRHGMPCSHGVEKKVRRDGKVPFAVSGTRLERPGCDWRRAGAKAMTQILHPLGFDCSKPHLATCHCDTISRLKCTDHSTAGQYLSTWPNINQTPVPAHLRGEAIMAEVSCHQPLPNCPLCSMHIGLIFLSIQSEC